MTKVPKPRLRSQQSGVKPDPSITNPNLMPWHDMNEKQVNATADRYTGLAPPRRQTLAPTTGAVQKGSYDSQNKSRSQQPKKGSEVQSNINADRREFNQDNFTPPDGSYADYWKGKMFNSPNAPGFNPQTFTVYRDQFGEESIPDTNDVDTSLYHYNPGSQYPIGPVSRGAAPQSLDELIQQLMLLQNK